MPASPTELRQLLQSARAASADGEIRNQDPFAIAMTVRDGFDARNTNSTVTRSAMVTPVVHPVLAAILDLGDARRLSDYSWSIGLGEDYTNTTFASVLRAIAPHAVLAEDTVTTAKGPKPFTEQTRNRGWALRRLVDHTPAYLPERAHERDARGNAQAWTTYVDHAAVRVHGDNPGFNPGGGALLVSCDGRQLWLKFRTDRFSIADLLPDGVEAPRLNVWDAGRNPLDPRPMYPAEAFAAADALRGIGMVVFDPDGDNTARMRQHVLNNVIAWPVPGRPAEARVSIGANVEPAGGNTSSFMSVGADELAELIDTYGERRCVIAPEVRDVARLVAVEPVQDDRLKNHQKLVVARHQATSIGLVNACAVGLGKTVMTLVAMANRAKSRQGYRGLVVAEANVRHQWANEATDWFPDALVVTVDSRRAVDSLLCALRMAADRPVVVITSYALASDVTRALDADEVVDLNGPGPVVVTAPEADADEVVATIVENAQGQLALSLFDVAQDPIASSDDEVSFVFTPSSSVAPAPEVAVEVDGDDAGDGDELLPSLGALLAAVDWDDLIADEAVVLANTGSRQSKALWALRARSEVALALTGTPIDKSLDDLGRLIAWTRNDPDMFRGRRLDNIDMSTAEGQDTFRRAIGPLVVRYDQSEIRGEIPRFKANVERISLHKAELALANAARTELRRVYDELVVLLDDVAVADPNDPDLKVLRDELKLARGAWLGGTTLARTAAADPESLRYSSSAGAAMLDAQGLIDSACSVGGSKRRRCHDLVVERVNAGEKVLVFTEFAQAARAVIGDLATSGIRVGGVLGGGGKARDRNIEAFRSGDLDVLICTAAGEKGLNLQVATSVIHYDLPWTPRKVVQRTGRAARIGSTASEIEVLFLIAGDTVEERVAGVVVARAAKALQALDAHRGVKLADTEFGQVLAVLAPEVSELELDEKENQLLALTKVALAS